MSSSSASGCARIMNALRSMLPGVREMDAQQPKQQTTIGPESGRRKPIVWKFEDDGRILWRFKIIEDEKSQKEGVDIRASGFLPDVRFKYCGYSDDVPEPPPNNTDTMIKSFWSMIPEANTRKKWVRKFLEDQQKHPMTYSNLVHVVFLNPILSSRVPTTPPHYKAHLMIRQPGLTECTEIERYANEQFKIDSSTINGALCLIRR